MRLSRPVLSAVVLVLLLLSVAPAAFAAQPTEFPVEFTIDPAICSDIESTVTGTGIWREVTNTRVGKDGLTYVVYTAMAHGTAVDEAGTTYRFTYANHQMYAMPNDGSPFEIRMNDQFNLVAAGGANDIHVGFVAIVTTTSPTDFSSASFEFINQHGYEGPGFPPCDPI